ncbi:MAG: hypothetical protein J6B30_05570 [Muribaculaceae bacterium]|nr:hypothetical protein [Muribaculaceae bacterium]
MKNQDEINLINFFTRNKSLTRAQRARFASLVARDCLTNHNEDFNNTDECLNDSDIFYHSPKKMIEFLSLFSRDDRFKWYTHKWDMSMPLNIDKFIIEQKKNKGVLSKMLFTSGPVINQSTYNNVWNFINFDNNDYTWKNTSFDNIKYGWHSIVELSKKNPNIPIDILKLEDGRQFKDYIRMFKSTIEFRTDLREDDRFSELIWNSINAALPKDFKVEYTSNFDEIGYDLNIYCDVIGILNALQTICNWIVRHKSRGSEVCVDLVSEDEFYILKINQKGSYFDNIQKLEKPSGDLEEIRKRLFSVCDFTMEGDFNRDGRSQGSLIIKALNRYTSMSENKMTPCEVINSDKNVGGVIYLLKIYKRI